MWISVILKILHAPHNFKIHTLVRDHRLIYEYSTSVWTIHEIHVNVLNKEPKTAHQNITQIMLEKIRNLKYWKDIKIMMPCLILVLCNSIVTSINLGFGRTPFSTWKYHLCYQVNFCTTIQLSDQCFVSFASLHPHLYLKLLFSTEARWPWNKVLNS